MNSIALQLAARYLRPVFLIFSIYVLFKGHNAPGGGFIGGLLASSGILFYAFAHGVEKAYGAAYLKPKTFLTVGLTLVLISVIAGFLSSEAILTGLWTKINLGITHLKVGTPLLFDTGIYFLVVGAMLTITLSIMEELEWK